MSAAQSNESAIGTDVVTTKHGNNVVFRNYVVERPTHARSVRAAEAILDITITVPYLVSRVWPIFKDVNSWMNRFGYYWEGLPGDNENRFVRLGSKAADLKYGSDGAKTTYVVRKVVPEKLIYFDSLPGRMIDKDGWWTGHNLMTLKDLNGRTEISVFMEHTWFSETLSSEVLLAEARWVMFDAALGFWRDYFIPDLVSLLETGKVTATPAS
jgi:hypothetical protein